LVDGFVVGHDASVFAHGGHQYFALVGAEADGSDGGNRAVWILHTGTIEQVDVPCCTQAGDGLAGEKLKALRHQRTNHRAMVRKKAPAQPRFTLGLGVFSAARPKRMRASTMKMVWVMWISWMIGIS